MNVFSKERSVLSGMDRKSQIDTTLQCLQTIKQKMLSKHLTIFKTNPISYSQWIVLHMIAHSEGIGVKELSQLLNISSSAATQLVDGLVKKGYLIREPNPADRRALKIHLSEDTRSLLSASRKKIYSLFDVLSDEELAQFCDLTMRIINARLKRLDI
jgi:DNA-binding MarR family transcriptional regulator